MAIGISASQALDRIQEAAGLPDEELLEVVEARIGELVALAHRLVLLADPTDPGGVADRKTVTLNDLINQARSALGVQEGDGSGQ